MADDARRALTFREMSVADLDEVLRIETRAYAFPWTRGIFSDCINGGHECRVACLGGEIVGHAVVSAAAGEAHLLNVCIMRERQGGGLGREFVHHLIDRASVRGAQVMFLEVRPSNRTAIALYESLGFVQIGTRKDYYPGEHGREDALVLALQPL
jgi:ribosomal-protein-alanine N-acetyltransferase